MEEHHGIQIWILKKLRGNEEWESKVLLVDWFTSSMWIKGGEYMVWEDCHVESRFRK